MTGEFQGHKIEGDLAEHVTLLGHQITKMVREALEKLAENKVSISSICSEIFAAKAYGGNKITYDRKVFYIN